MNFITFYCIQQCNENSIICNIILCYTPHLIFGFKPNCYCYVLLVCHNKFVCNHKRKWLTKKAVEYFIYVYIYIFEYNITAGIQHAKVRKKFRIITCPIWPCFWVRYNRISVLYHLFACFHWNCSKWSTFGLNIPCHWDSDPIKIIWYCSNLLATVNNRLRDQYLCNSWTIYVKSYWKTEIRDKIILNLYMFLLFQYAESTHSDESRTIRTRLN